MLLFCFLWLLWCFVHSFLVHPSVVEAIEKGVPSQQRYYRLSYNLFSMFSLSPLVIYTFYDPGQLVFTWSGIFVIPRMVLLFCSILLFYFGASKYDPLIFLGIRQIKTGRQQQLLCKEQSVDITGVFGLTRHPWYLGSLCLLWSALSAYHLKPFVMVIILSLNLWVGTILEEKKLVTQLGHSYKEYQKNVSMLIPWRWVRKKIDRGK